MAVSFRRHSSNGEPTARDGAAVTIAPMRRRHVNEVVEIERTIFPQPWTKTLYLSELALGRSTRRYYVALFEGKVIGYAGAMVMVGEGHVTTIGVATPWQSFGIGRRLLYQLARDVRDMSADALTLEVRITNKTAQALYHAFGFVPAGIRKNYYAEIGEDGLVMWANDIGSDAYGQRLDEIGAAITRRLIDQSQGHE